MSSKADSLRIPKDDFFEQVYQSEVLGKYGPYNQRPIVAITTPPIPEDAVHLVPKGAELKQSGFRTAVIIYKALIDHLKPLIRLDTAEEMLRHLHDLKQEILKNYFLAAGREEVFVGREAQRTLADTLETVNSNSLVDRLRIWLLRQDLDELGARVREAGGMTGLMFVHFRQNAEPHYTLEEMLWLPRDITTRLASHITIFSHFWDAERLRLTLDNVRVSVIEDPTHLARLQYHQPTQNHVILMGHLEQFPEPIYLEPAGHAALILPIDNPAQYSDLAERLNGRTLRLVTVDRQGISLIPEDPVNIETSPGSMFWSKRGAYILTLPLEWSKTMSDKGKSVADVELAMQERLEMDEGFVAGGGAALYRAGRWLLGQKSESPMGEQIRQIFADVLQQPLQLVIGASDDTTSLEALSNQSHALRVKDQQSISGHMMEVGVYTPLPEIKRILNQAYDATAFEILRSLLSKG